MEQRAERQDPAEQLADGRREAQRNARKPPVIVAFVATYVAFAAYRLAVHVDRDWYEALVKPPWLLPLAGQEAAWVIAFGLLAYSSVAMFAKAGGTKTAHGVLALRLLHFVLLQLGVFLLFARHLLLPAAVAATLLLLTAAAIVGVARKRSKSVAGAVSAYAVWLAYDAAAVWALWLLNR